MSQTDAIGRATFHHIDPRADVRPTPREIRWLQHIQRHGSQSSLYLHELTRDTHRDPDTSRRQLQKLRAGRFLHCPRQQRATENASFHAYIYDLALPGHAFLRDSGLAKDTVTPTGHWVHGYMTSCITSSIDISASRAGVGYIPAHEILARSGASLGIEIGRRKLIPDQLFGLDYGGQFRFYVVEADRGTEPKSASAARKSYRSMIEQYRAIIGEKRYKAHYGLTAGMLLLAVFSSRTNERAFLTAADEIMGTRSAYLLTQTIPDFHLCFRPPPLLTELFEQPWNRPSGHPPFRIDRP